MHSSGLASFFHLRERGTTVRTEVLAGVITFIVMSYIIVVNPAILASGPLEGLGPPFTAAVTATCLVSGLLCLAMGLLTNYPFALAPGLGLNAVVAFQLILGLGLPWQAAMGIVLCEGLLITLLVLTGFRTAVLNAVPLTLKRAISVGIGLFILFIGLNNAGIVQRGEGTPVTLGSLTTFPVLLAVIGLLLTVVFTARGLRAALLLGILGTTAIGLLAHALFGVDVTNAAPGVQGALPSSFPAPSFATIGQGVNLDAFRLVGPLVAGLAIFSLMLSDFFDTMGTVVGVGEQAGFVTPEGELPGAQRVLLVDSLAAALGGAFGTSSVTTYIESAAGVAAGGRTGLTAVVTGLLFLAAIVLAPLASIVPSEATAPALIIVGFLMCAPLREIDFADFATGFPALLTMLLMPFTYSITNGIGAGLIAYTCIAVAQGRARAVSPVVWLVTAAFLVYFLAPLIEQLGR